jgi:hypothetical protein
LTASDKNTDIAAIEEDITIYTRRLKKTCNGKASIPILPGRRRLFSVIQYARPVKKPYFNILEKNIFDFIILTAPWKRYS